MSSEGFKILDKLLAGQYNIWYIILCLMVFILYLVYHNKLLSFEYVKNYVKSFFTKDFAEIFMRETHLFAQLDQEKVNSTITNTGDRVKDNLLVDIVTCIVDITKKRVFEYLHSLNFRSLDPSKVHHDCELLMQSIYKEIKESITAHIPAKVVSKLNAIFQDLEMISYTELSDYGPEGENGLELLKHHTKSICVSYSRISRRLCEIFHAMNGDLNGIFYKNFIVGVYDSSLIFKGQFPLPNESREADANMYSVRLKTETTCSCVAFLAFHDTELNITNVEEVGNRTVSMSYCFENQIEKSNYQRQRVLTLIDSYQIDNLLINKAIYANREKEQDFSRLKNFMSENNLQGLLIQPVIKNKVELVGLLLLGWNNLEDFNDLDIDGKLHGIASRAVRFFNYNSE